MEQAAHSRGKLARVIARFEKKIEDGDYYEAHQTLRTIANRYVRSQAYGEALDLITHGAQAFLAAKQGGSGTDLIFYLLEVYETAGVAVDDQSVARLVQLLVLVDAHEPNIRDVVTGMNNWSVKFGDYKFGDPHLHNAIANKLLESGQHVYEAERYLLLGTHKSVAKYVELMWQYFLQTGVTASSNSGGSDAEFNGTVGDFISRLILNYLFISNIAFALEARDSFVELLLKQFPTLGHDTISKSIDRDSSFKMYYFESNTELNFLQLLILTCQTMDKSLFQTLKNEYSTVATKYQQQLDFLGQEYFGIVAPRQSNFLQDMMSGFLGSG